MFGSFSKSDWWVSNAVELRSDVNKENVWRKSWIDSSPCKFDSISSVIREITTDCIDVFFGINNSVIVSIESLENLSDVFFYVRDLEINKSVFKSGLVQSSSVLLFKVFELSQKSNDSSDSSPDNYWSKSICLEFNIFEFRFSCWRSNSW